MKRFMNSLLFAIVMLSLLWTGIANAQSGIFYNPERDGEGIVVFTKDTDLVMLFFSHVYVVGETAPVVSPRPPEALVCDEKNIFLTLLADYYDGQTAYGGVYYNDPVQTFPVPDNSLVADPILVGSFAAEKDQDGFIVTMERDWVICDLSLFYGVHDFVEVLVKP